MSIRLHIQKIGVEITKLGTRTGVMVPLVLILLCGLVTDINAFSKAKRRVEVSQEQIDDLEAEQEELTSDVQEEEVAPVPVAKTGRTRTAPRVVVPEVELEEEEEVVAPVAQQKRAVRATRTSKAQRTKAKSVQKKKVKATKKASKAKAKKRVVKKSSVTRTPKKTVQRPAVVRTSNAQRADRRGRVQEVAVSDVLVEEEQREAEETPARKPKAAMTLEEFFDNGLLLLSQATIDQRGPVYANLLVQVDVRLKQAASANNHADQVKLAEYKKKMAAHVAKLKQHEGKAIAIFKKEFKHASEGQGLSLHDKRAICHKILNRLQAEHSKAMKFNYEVLSAILGDQMVDILELDKELQEEQKHEQADR